MYRKVQTAASHRKKFKTLASLLDAQPRGLTADPEHRLLWDRFISSDKLMRLRISPRCWRLLDRASIPPENLKSFYRTYKLPEDSFFPLFLAVKSRWLKSRALWKRERIDSILGRMKDLPGTHTKAIEALAEYEEEHHPRGLHPVWDKELFPKTRKRTEEILKMNDEGWHALWLSHLRKLSRRYPTIPDPEDKDDTRSDDSRYYNASVRILASLVLEQPGNSRKEIARSYRRLSKALHPDTGGDAAAFRRLKEACDILQGI